MIVEVRTYKIKEGRRADFLRFFETRAVPAQQLHGMKVLGPLVDLEKPDSFVWLRAFPSHQERDRMKEAFYEGPTWKNELEAIAMPMLEDYAVVLTKTTDEFVTFESVPDAKTWAAPATAERTGS
ncbi:MAG: NIPSNAP family protein [Acidobacteriota bacterium]|nr:NIPSNAP family protein [Acidobacteriota bacterium]